MYRLGSALPSPKTAWIEPLAQRAQACPSLRHKPHQSSFSADQESVGAASGPFWQGEPTDRLPIWRYGFYQGNDPDPFIRGQLIRDRKNGLTGRR